MSFRYCWIVGTQPVVDMLSPRKVFFSNWSPSSGPLVSRRSVAGGVHGFRSVLLSLVLYHGMKNLLVATLNNKPSYFIPWIKYYWVAGVMWELRVRQSSAYAQEPVFIQERRICVPWGV